MKYFLDKPWPVGSVLLPRAIVIDAASEDQFSVIARGHVPPPDAIPLDDEALALMKAHYASGGFKPDAISSVFMGTG